MSRIDQDAVAQWLRDQASVHPWGRATRGGVTVADPDMSALLGDSLQPF